LQETHETITKKFAQLIQWYSLLGAEKNFADMIDETIVELCLDCLKAKESRGNGCGVKHVLCGFINKKVRTNK
jgi:hypothetical protein